MTLRVQQFYILLYLQSYVGTVNEQVRRSDDQLRPGRRAVDLHPRGDLVPRVSYEEYLIATALTFARRHRPVWSWQKWRRICRCGADLPCHARHRIPINRGHWPGEEAQ